MKVIIVEGTSDKKAIQAIVNETVEIVCTNGTISYTRMDELIDEYYDKEVYVLVDADSSGERLRKQLQREFPQAEHIYIDRSYKEVATAPKYHLATILLNADIDVHTQFLKK